MPYRTNRELPDSVTKHVPSHGQDIYRNAYNSALRQYGQEERAHRVAWAAVKNMYRKGEDNNWHPA